MATVEVPVADTEADLLFADLADEPALVLAISGGPDSTALIWLAARWQARQQTSPRLLAVTIDHGLRPEGRREAAAVKRLAAKLGVAHRTLRWTGPKPSTGLQEKARAARYRLLYDAALAAKARCVLAAHTLDDQAETVLAKFLRGAWTVGLSGIHPVVKFPEGRIIRPLLQTTRAQIETYLKAIGQPWREDSSNRHLTFTRNRIRHELLPQLETWNPKLREHLAQMAELARDEEAWWNSEMDRRATQHLLAGRPVRGGGRASGQTIALDCSRLAGLPTAIQRRLLRYAAAKLGAAPDFLATESLRGLALTGKAGQKCELAQGLIAERTPRELRLSIAPKANAGDLHTGQEIDAVPEFILAIPGELEAPPFDLRLRVTISAPIRAGQATLRNWKPGDRVTLRYSNGPRKVKEVLQRMRVTGADRRVWPVLELCGRIIWMKAVELEPEPGIHVSSTSLNLIGGNDFRVSSGQDGSIGR